MHRYGRHAGLLLGLALAMLLAACGGGSPATTGATTSAMPQTSSTAASAGAGLCGRSGAVSPTYRHVVVVIFENTSYSSVVGSPDAPTLNALARRCALATNYRAVAHPSLPNYLALVSGSTWGVRDDDPPSAHPISGPSIFSQLDAAGGSWREYMEDAPAPCPSESSGSYAVKHDPAAYFRNLRASCRHSDVPLGALATGAFARDLRTSQLPSFALVVPNLCNDMHDCPVATGDAWLRRFLAVLGSSPAYRRGDVALFVTWDENDGGPGNQVPLLVAAPSVPPGTRVGVPMTHYSLLAIWQRLLGLPCLGQACRERAARSAFGL